MVEIGVCREYHAKKQRDMVPWNHWWQKESNSSTKTRQFGTIPLTLLKLSFKENYNTTRPFKIIVTINQRFTSYIGFRFRLPYPLLCPCLSLIILPSVTVPNWGWGWGEDNFCKVGLYSPALVLKKMCWRYKTIINKKREHPHRSTLFLLSLQAPTRLFQNETALLTPRICQNSVRST